MKQFRLMVPAVIIVLILSGCGSGSGGNTSVRDVKVIDGYVVDGYVTDSDGQQASADAVVPGLYHFTAAPLYPIYFTVGTGRIADTNMTMDINMSAEEGEVISPVTTLIHGNAAAAANLTSVLGAASSEVLFSDYIENNDINLAKLAQLCYAMIKDTNATQSFLNSITTSFDATADTGISTLIARTIRHDVFNYSTKTFLQTVMGFDGTLSYLEKNLFPYKPDVGYSFKVTDKTALETLIGNYMDETNTTRKALYKKQIEFADTSSVTNMERLFDSYRTFYGYAVDLDLNGWDTSHVTTMRSLFAFSSFNSYIGDWNTSNVTNMSGMFYATPFNQPIDNWDTSKVTDMSAMFMVDSAFNQPIGDWDTANVTDMSHMFSSNSSFNQPIANWDTANVIDMSGMFNNAAAFNQPIGNWDTSKVTDMSGMFQIGDCINYAFCDLTDRFVAGIFNQPLTDWNTSNVTNMSHMFFFQSAFNQPIGNWDTSKVTSMEGMFYMGTAFNQPIANWNTSNVTDMQFMFYRATVFNQPLGDWNITNVTDFSYWIYYARSYSKDLSGWTIDTTRTNIDNMLVGSNLSFFSPYVPTFVP